MDPEIEESAAMEQVFQSEYLNVWLDRDRRVVEIVRSSVPFKALPEFVAELDGLLGALPQTNTKEHLIVYDARSSPPPGGTTYMKAFSRMAQELTRRFGPVVVIARDVEMMETAERHGLPKVHFFTNEEAARKVVRELIAVR